MEHEERTRQVEHEERTRQMELANQMKTLELKEKELHIELRKMEILHLAHERVKRQHPATGNIDDFPTFDFYNQD